MSDQPTFLTPSALVRLQEELEELRTTGRAEIEDRIAALEQSPDAQARLVALRERLR